MLTPLDEITRQKIFVLSPSEMASTLLEYIHPENLEEKYGGAMPDVDENYLNSHLENP